MTTQEAIQAVREGRRATTESSLHKEFKWEVYPTCNHRQWRTIACDSETDVVECRDCGFQKLAACNFDDDYA